MWSYRNEGAFHEAVTNAILDDLVKAIAAALHATDCEVVCARRDFHDRDGRASQERLEAVRRPLSVGDELPRGTTRE